MIETDQGNFKSLLKLYWYMRKRGIHTVKVYRALGSPIDQVVRYSALEQILYNGVKL